MQDNKKSKARLLEELNYLRQKIHYIEKPNLPLEENRGDKERKAILRLSLDKTILGGAIEAAFKKVTEELAHILDVNRSSIWLFSSDEKNLVCKDLFEASLNKHSKGHILEKKQYPNYFKAITMDGCVYAHDAQNDLRTNEFKNDYLVPGGITSMLDTGIIVKGKLIGMVCAEHTGRQRYWTLDEIIFCNTIASLLTNTMLNNERKQTNKKLMESESRYGEMAQLLPQIVFETDEKGNLTFVNKHAFKSFGYTKKDFDHGINVFQTIVLNERAKAKKNMQKILSGYKVKTSAYTALRKDGSTFPIQLYISPVIKDKMPVGVRGIAIDITEQRKAAAEKAKLENQLHHAQKLETIGTLAGGIAHDFNNLLTPIIGYSQIELAKIGQLDSLPRSLENIINAANRAKDLVNQILLFSRQLKYERKPVLLSVLINESLQLLRPSLPSTIEICSKIEKNSPTVIVDPSQINQVIMNLCTNAFHAMEKKGGRLTIELDEVHLDKEHKKINPHLKQGHYALLKVTDTGTGIDSKIVNRIFEPFFSTKKVGKGTGLGLSVVHGIIRNHNGDICVHSKRNVGTTFSVYLPVYGNNSQRLLTDKKVIVGGQERILLVDDEEMVVEMFQLLLENLGYQVVCKTNSLEALKTFQQGPENFDLIITDLTMPNLTGFELIKKIRSAGSEIPVIMITGYSENIDSGEQKRFGINHMITKPVIAEDIAQTIRNVFRI